MSKQFILTLSLDGNAEINCTPLCARESGLGIGKDGLTWMEASFAAIAIDSHDELTITRTGDVPLQLQRNGRELELVPSHPTRLLAQDRLLWKNQATSHTLDIKKVYRQNTVSSFLAKLSKHAMFATAAAMLLSVVPGCDASRNQPKGDIAPIPAENDTVVPSVEKGKMAVDEDPVEVDSKNDTVVPSVEEGKMVVDEDPDVVVPNTCEGKCENIDDKMKQKTADEIKAMEEERKAVINRTAGEVVRVPADGDGADAPSDGDKDAALPPPELQDSPTTEPPKVVEPDRVEGRMPREKLPSDKPTTSSDGDKDAALPPPELKDPPTPEPPKDVKPERLGGKIMAPPDTEVKPSNESSK